MVFKKMIRKYRSSKESAACKSNSIFRSKAILSEDMRLAETFSGDSSDSVASSFSCAQSTVSSSSKKFSCAVRDAEVMQLRRSIKALEESYREDLAEAQASIWRTADDVCDLKMQLQQTQRQLEATTKKMLQQEEECFKAKEELASAKDQLQSVSSVLMQTQIALYEKEEQLSTLKQVVQFGQGVVGYFTI